MLKYALTPGKMSRFGSQLVIIFLSVATQQISSLIKKLDEVPICVGLEVKQVIMTVKCCFVLNWEMMFSSESSYEKFWK